MRIVEGIMQYVGEEKEEMQENNSFRFKGDHKGEFILLACVKKEKMCKGKVGNAVRIATKTMERSHNRVIRIKHIGYNNSETYLKDAITANRYLDLKEGNIEYRVPT